MCQSQAEGGKRCAAHTRPAYRAAIDAIQATPDYAEKVALLDAHKGAIIAYAATQTGAQDFAIEADTIAAWAEHEMRGTAKANTQHAITELITGLRLTQTQAAIRADVDREVLRRLKYERSGTHAGADVPDCETFHRDGSGLTIATVDYAAAMTPGRYESGNAETVDWCDRVEAHHGFARIHAPYLNDLECLHCADEAIDAYDPPTWSNDGGHAINKHGYDMTPGATPTHVGI